MSLNADGILRPVWTVQPTDKVLVAHLVVPGEPYSKGRPRVTKNGTYTPANTRLQTAKVRDAFKALDLPEYDKEGTFRLDAHFYLGTRRHVDGDNLLKLVKDALNVIAYDDDHRVYDSRVKKWHTSKERARTELFLYTIPKDREEAA